MLYREDDEGSPNMPRRFKRAYSECPGTDAVPGQARGRASSILSIIRTQSDSDLRKIDRKRTFAQIEIVEPNDLLAKVANALGQLRPADDDDQLQGVHGFSDSQILASERTWSGWSNGRTDNSHRVRAASETKLPENELGNNNAYEWTWCGANNQINDLRKLRQKSGFNGRDSFAAPSSKRRPSEGMANATIIPMPLSQESTITAGQNGFMGKFNNIFRRRTMSTSSSLMQQLPSNIHEDAIKYINATSNDYGPHSSSRHLNTNTYGGAAGAGVPGYSRRGSIFESLQSENSQILENTTIADLIKVLEAVHTQAALEDELPKRKLGTASLTPPDVMPSVYGLFDPTPDSRAYETYNPALGRRGSMFPSIASYPASHNTRRSSLMPTSSTGGGGGNSSNKQQPPPYSSLEVPPVVTKRRFSVRPTQLSSYSPQHGASNSSLASSSSASQVPPVTRKLSLRPSPLARNPASASFRDSARFAKPISLQREVISQNARQRHGSLSNLPERPPEKKRYDSK